MSATSSDRERPGKRGRVGRGRHYEQKAADFFVRQGFDILERNWQAGHKEIDLITRKDDLIVFVEVKAAGGDSFGHPSEWIDTRKKDNLISAARQYTAEKAITDCDLRFDVITFVEDKLEHYPNAFAAE
jgi:putative endonuclease